MVLARCLLVVVPFIALLSSTITHAQEPTVAHIPPSPTHPPPPVPPSPAHHPPLHPHANNGHPNPRHHFGKSFNESKNEKKILAMTLPMIVLLVLFGLTACGVWYMIRRAKRGAFCCLKPRFRYQNVDDEYKEDDDTVSPPASGSPPPDYTLTDIAPPVYQDALQDVIVSQATVGSEYLHSVADLPPEYQESSLSTQRAATPLDYQTAATPPDYQAATTPPQSASLPPAQPTSSHSTREPSPASESDSTENTESDALVVVRRPA